MAKGDLNTSTIRLWPNDRKLMCEHLSDLKTLLCYERQIWINNPPLFLQRNLSYRKDNQTNSFFITNNESSNGSEKENDSTRAHSSNFVVTGIKLDPLKGFKSARFQFFLLRKNTMATKEKQRVYLGSTFASFPNGSNHNIINPIKVQLPKKLFDDDKKSQNFQYSIAGLVLYRKDDKPPVEEIFKNHSDSDNVEPFFMFQPIESGFIQFKFETQVERKQSRQVWMSLRQLNQIVHFTGKECQTQWVDIVKANGFPDPLDDLTIEHDTFLESMRKILFLNETFPGEPPVSARPLLAPRSEQIRGQRMEFIYSLDSVPLVKDVVRFRKTVTKKENSHIFYSFGFLDFFTEMWEFVCPFCDINCVDIDLFKHHVSINHQALLFTFEEQTSQVPNPKDPTSTMVERFYLVNIQINFHYCPQSGYLPVHAYFLGQAAAKKKINRKCPSFDIMASAKMAAETVEEKELDLHVEPCDKLAHRLADKRMFFHSQSCLAKMPNEIDVDSEDEEYPEWVKMNSIRMIDDFADVNEGEKGIMKMWNLFMMKNNTKYTGFCHMPIAMRCFIKENAQEIVDKNLRRNCILHMVNFLARDLISHELLTELAVILNRTEGKSLQSEHKVEDP